jgi:hypothetical protein
MRYGKELLLGTNVEDYVDDREVGKSRGGNYDEARRQGSSFGAVLDLETERQK